MLNERTKRGPLQSGWVLSKSGKEQEFSDDLLYQALYLINKAAKESKDKKTQFYQRKDYKQLYSSRARERQLYRLKDRALQKLLADGRAQVLGVDELTLEHKTMQLLVFIFNGSLFHMPVENLEGLKFNNLRRVGKYDRSRWFHRRPICTISELDAIHLLEDFIRFGVVGA